VTSRSNFQTPRLPYGGERRQENNDMPRRGPYLENSNGELIASPEVTEAYDSKEYPPQDDVGQGSSDSPAPNTDSNSMDGSDNQLGASSDARAIDPGDGSRSADLPSHSMDGAEQAPKKTNNESRDQSELRSSLG
jgi:hypothetical protein